MTRFAVLNLQETLRAFVLFIYVCWCLCFAKEEK
jgi:hypothetical protein